MVSYGVFDSSSGNSKEKGIRAFLRTIYSQIFLDGEYKNEEVVFHIACSLTFPSYLTNPAMQIKTEKHNFSKSLSVMEVWYVH